MDNKRRGLLSLVELISNVSFLSRFVLTDYQFRYFTIISIISLGDGNKDDIAIFNFKRIDLKFSTSVFSFSSTQTFRKRQKKRKKK